MQGNHNGSQERVFDAIKGGANTVALIAARTGLDVEAINVATRRLHDAGDITREQAGRITHYYPAHKTCLLAETWK